MTFDVTKKDIAQAQKCPPGMHKATLIEVDESYFNEKGTEIEKATFETTKGHSVPYWFNNKMLSSVIEFVEAADNVKLEENTAINLKDYIGKQVCISVSHRADKNNKPQAQIDTFYSADKVPF